MKMNELRWEKNTTKGVSAGPVDFSIVNGPFNSYHWDCCTHMNAWLYFYILCECYYCQEIEADRCAVSIDYI